jgi:plasmid maintenance system antidote protein VapI
MPSTGDALRMVLAAVDLSQAGLAERAKVSAKHVNQIVQGRARLTPDIAVAIADAIADHLLALDLAGATERARARQRQGEP